MNVYYVYALVDPRDYCPFYIGKGKNLRWRDHLNPKGPKVNKRKCQRIDELMDLGLEPLIWFIYRDLDEETAYSLEGYQIDLWGRSDRDPEGYLTNCLSGGRGRIGYRASQETRDLLSGQRKGKKKSQQWIELMADLEIDRTKTLTQCLNVARNRAGGRPRTLPRITVTKPRGRYKPKAPERTRVGAFLRLTGLLVALRDR